MPDGRQQDRVDPLAVARVRALPPAAAVGRDRRLEEDHIARLRDRLVDRDRAAGERAAVDAVVLAALAGNGVGRAVAPPARLRETVARVADDGGAVLADAAGRDDLEAAGVVIEVQEVGDRPRRQSADVGVFHPERRVEGGARRLQCPRERRGDAVGHRHGNVVEVDLVKRKRHRVLLGGHSASGEGDDRVLGHRQCEPVDALDFEDDILPPVEVARVGGIQRREQRGAREGVHGVLDDDDVELNRGEAPRRRRLAADQISLQAVDEQPGGALGDADERERTGLGRDGREHLGPGHRLERDDSAADREVRVVEDEPFEGRWLR